MLRCIKPVWLLAACTALTLGFMASSHAIEIQTFEVKSRQIDQFQIGSEEKKFGPLEFVGGLEMIGASRDFGAWSGIAIAGDQTRFLGVADTGFWLRGEILRDEQNKPVGISASISEMAGKNGNPFEEKWRADAEGIALAGDMAVVSFERAHRISKYQFSGEEPPVLLSESAPPVPLYELRDNRGFEGIAFAPEGTNLSGSLLGISEKSLDKNKNIMGFVTKPDGNSFEFSVKRTGKFDVTDLAFLPDGNLILLERRFNVSDGIAMRLRHIKTDTIKDKATVDGPVLITADMLYQIDNMEGLDITVDEDGTPRLTIVSDDNHSLLQRNLLLEFRLVGEIN